MKTSSRSLFEHCKHYLRAQAYEKPGEPPPCFPAVTISRECGAGAVTIAGLVAAELRRQQGECPVPWAVFDRELIRKVLDDHLLPARIAPYFKEDSAHPLKDAFESLLGLHPEAPTLVQYVSRTIHELAVRGNVILVGRGANFVTAGLDHVLHVRLIARPEFRLRHLAEFHSLTPKEATQLMARTDSARRRYVRQNFSASISDPQGYHLVLNTAELGFPSAARIIAQAVATLPGRTTAASRPASLPKSRREFPVGTRQGGQAREINRQPTGSPEPEQRRPYLINPILPC